MNMHAPAKVPEKCFYYHYKHDPSGPINNYAYEVVGVGHHTEEDCRTEDMHMVVYRPLYDALVYKLGMLFDLRPLEMWMGEVEVDGGTKLRFTKITDTEIIKELEQIKKAMYK